MAHFIHVITLALSLIYPASGKGDISSELSFDCAKNGSMMIFMANGSYGSIYAAGTNNKTCSAAKHINGDRMVYEIKGCDIKEAIRVILMRASQTESPEDEVVGGKESLFYELKCNEVPVGGYVINRTVNVNESADTNYKPYSESPFYLSMEIKDSSLSSLTKTVTVGSELHLVISGNDGFEFRAESCIASDGIHKHNKTLISNGLSVEMYMISNFSSVPITTVTPNVLSTSQNKHSLEAILYAFHFANSHDVEIMCIITVCQKDDDTCSLTTKSPVTTPLSTTGHNVSSSGRRRRDTLRLPQTQTLRTTFRVVDQFGDNNGIVKSSAAFRRPVFWLPVAFIAMCAGRALM